MDEQLVIKENETDTSKKPVRKRKSTTNNISTSNKKICRLGSCGDEKDYNACRAQRPRGAAVDRISFFPTKEGHKILDKRFYSYTLLQNPEQLEYLELCDVSIQLRLVTFHTSNTVDSLPIRVNSKEFRVRALLGPLRMHFYLVRLCDVHLATKKELKINDVLLDPKNIRDHELSRNLENLMEYHVTLDCNTTCALQDHVITMCRPFKKGEKQICMTSNDNNTPIYDTGNYRFLILIDYLD